MRITKKIKSFLFPVTVFFSNTVIAHADSIFETSQDADINADLSDFAEKLDDIYSHAASVILPLAAVGLAMTLFSGIFYGEKELQGAKKKIAIICLAVIFFFLIPKLIRLGVSIGEDYQWQPPN